MKEEETGNFSLKEIEDATSQKTILSPNRKTRAAELIFRITQIGSWFYDTSANIKELDENILHILEIELDDHLQTEQIMNMLQGNSREKYEQAVKAAIQQRQSFDIELEILTAKKTYKWIRSIGVPVIEDDKVLGVEGVIQELTDKRLQYKRRIIDKLFGLIPDSYFILDLDGIIRDLRIKDHLSLDISPDFLVHRYLHEIFPSEVYEIFTEYMQYVIERQCSCTFEFELPQSNGVHRYECRLSLLTESTQLIAVVRDISEEHATKQAAAESEERYQNLLQHAPFPIFIVDMKNRCIRYGNNRAISQFGLQYDDIVGVSVERFYQNKDSMNQFNEKLAKDGFVIDFEIPMVDWLGSPYWALMSASIITYDNEPAVLATINNITERKEIENALRVSEEKYRSLALVDRLTGVPNKNSFKMEAEKLLCKTNIRYACLMLDVDHFKLVNDLFGYDKGNQLLIHMANVIRGNIHSHEIFARAEADKFHILLEYTTQEQLEQRIEKIFKEIAEFTFRSDSRYHLVINVGIYVVKKSGLTMDHILDRANLAIRKIKGSHNSSYFFYDDEIRSRLLMEREIESDMNAALVNNEFKVFVQPKYDLRTNEIVGGEALVRWYHSTKGVIPPMQFIPIFEKNGFITELDMYVLDVICQKQKTWIEQGYKPKAISINQSKIHFFNPHYLEDLQAITSRYQIDPSFIELEFTESAVFDNIDILLEVINELHAIGFKMSIDDFGTGYSSLNMLKDVKIDTLKLDRGFIVDTKNEERSHIIIESIIDMAKKLSMTIVAEGIETKEQQQLLQNMECDIGQGYYFAKPMPIDEFYDLLQENSVRIPLEGEL